MSETKRDYYEVLGIPKDADEAAIKKAYRVLAKKYHPDANPGDKEAEAKFKEASEAYAVLSDAEKRRKYDQFGHAAFEGGAGGAGFDFNSADFQDIFSEIFGGGFGGGGFGGFGGFADFFGGGRQSQRADQPTRGMNVRATIRITFDEAMKGIEKNIQGNYREECANCHATGAKPGTSPETCGKCQGRGKIVYTSQSLFGTMQNVAGCPDCNGSGKVIKDKCPECRGTGYKTIKKTFSVSIPAGIDNGQVVRLSGCGEPGTNGGPRGDLLVEIVVSSHPSFKRDGMDIYSTVKMPFTTAALGGSINIETIDGVEPYNVKAGTQTDTTIRLRGKGAPSVRNKNVRGDHYVTLVVAVPTSLSLKQKNALKAFAETLK